jgi:hypothetical protein
MAAHRHALGLPSALTGTHEPAGLSPHLGAEAYLLSRGISLDVVGRRLHQMPAATTATIENLWPRDGFARELAAATTEQAQLRTQSHSALLHELGFVKPVEGNPLERHAG